jgi:hypothetical protein
VQEDLEAMKIKRMETEDAEERRVEAKCRRS